MISIDTGEQREVIYTVDGGAGIHDPFMQPAKFTFIFKGAIDGYIDALRAGCA
jgi:hypothetical protein